MQTGTQHTLTQRSDTSSYDERHERAELVLLGVSLVTIVSVVLVSLHSLLH